MKRMKVRVTFFEEVLGSWPNNKDIYRDFIGSKAPSEELAEEEAESIEGEGAEDVFAKGTTVFPRDEKGNPALYDYQIKGFFKNSGKAMSAVGGNSKLVAYKTKIDNLIFIEERIIPFNMPEKAVVGDCQRPLKAQTAKGERVALANSETVPAGTTIEFTILVFLDSLTKHVESWLNYGKFNGIGQWHNSGKGRFTWARLQDWEKCGEGGEDEEEEKPKEKAKAKAEPDDEKPKKRGRKPKASAAVE